MATLLTRPSLTLTVLVVILASLSPSSNAALPASITSSNANCIGETVSPEGSEIDVAAMLSHEEGSSNAAVFRAVDLTFEGTLTISCPSSTSTRDYRIPIMITIVNGSTQQGVMPASPHILVVGVLGRGSRVCIEGGLYTFVGASSSFVGITNTTLVGGSTIELVGASFTAPRSPLSQVKFAIINASSLVIADGSTLSVANATVDLQSDASVSNQFYVVDSRLPSRLLHVLNNSFVTFTGIVVRLINSTVAGEWVGGTLLCWDFTISDNSTVYSDNVALVLRSASLQKMLEWSGLQVLNALLISSKSTLAIIGTTVGLVGANLTGESRFYALWVQNPSVSNGSAVIVANTKFSLFDSTLEGPHSAYAVKVSSPTWLSDGSRLYVQNTYVTMIGCRLQQFTLHVVQLAAATYLSAGCILHVALTTIDLRITHALQLDIRVFFTAAITASEGGTLSFTGTAVSFQNATWVEASTLMILFITSHTIIDSGSAMSIADTNVDVDGLVSLEPLNVHIVQCNSFIQVTKNSTLNVLFVKAVTRNPSPNVATVCTIVKGMPIRIDGIVVVENIQVEGWGSSLIESTQLLGGSGRLQITNSFTWGQAIVTVPEIMDSYLRIYVCRSFLNNSACTKPTADVFPCARNISLLTQLCTPTVTVPYASSTQTTPTQKTLVLSPSESPSPTHIRSTTPTSSATLTTSVTVHEHCNYTCSDVVALVVAAGGNDDAIACQDVHWPTSEASGGCTPLSIPYASTTGGRKAHVLLRLRGVADVVTPTLGTQLDSSLSTVRAQYASRTFLSATNGSVVMIVEILREATEPARAEMCSLTLSSLGLPCVSSDGSHLPRFEIELGSSPAPLSEGEKTAIGVVSVVSVDLQLVAAVGLGGRARLQYCTR